MLHKYLYKLIHFLHQYRIDINHITFFAFLGGVVELGIPLGIQAIVGFTLGASMVTSIYVLIALVLIAVLISGLLQLKQMSIIERIQQKIYTQFIFQYAEKIPKIDLIASDLFYLPEKINCFIDTHTLQKKITKILIDLPAAAIQIILGIILLTFYNPLFILFGITLLILLFLILKYSSISGFATSIQESNFKYKALAWLQEIGSSVKTFKFNQNNHLHLQRTDQLTISYLTSRTKHFGILMIQFKTLIFFKFIITLLLLSTGVYLLVQQKLTLGQFIASEIVILSIINATEKIIKSLENIYDIVTGLEKLTSITELPSDKNGNIDFKSESINIQFKNLNFKYDDNKILFTNLNLEIKNGSLVGISGMEGIGKTTLAKILSGAISHYQGSYQINHIPFENYNKLSLWKNIGLYSVPNEIFSGTILENITVGRNYITEESIINTSIKLGFGELLSAQEYGFQTWIDNQGKNISTSLIKKILLLRTLCNAPKLAILEDPWQGLEDQKSVKNYILSNANQSTFIIFTNDQEFLGRCHQKFVMSQNTLITLNS